MPFLSSVMWLIVLQVAVQSLWNMRLAVFVKPEHEGRVNHVSTASVRTGLGNTLGGFNPLNPILNARAVGAQRSRRRKCVFNGPEVKGQMFAFPQGTRGPWASPFTSTEPPLDLWTATWLLEAKKSWGASRACVYLGVFFCKHTAANSPSKNPCPGGTKTLWTSSGCSAWVKRTARLTSACASLISSGVGTSTTGSTSTCRSASLSPEEKKKKQQRFIEKSGRVMPLLLPLPDQWQDILKHVSKREFEELMCADQLTRERHKRKAFLNFSEFQFTFTLCKKLIISGLFCNCNWWTVEDWRSIFLHTF